MQYLRVFFSPNGRITRRDFWLGHLMILSATVLFSLVAGFVIGILSTFPGLDSLKTSGPIMIGLAVGLLALGAEVTLAVKRMHDRDASGLWVVGLVVIALLTNIAVSGQHLYAGENPVTPLTLGLTVFTAIMGGWMILELGFLRGTEGKNSYGDDPLSRAADGEPKPAAVQKLSMLGPLLLDKSLVLARLRRG